MRNEVQHARDVGNPERRPVLHASLGQELADRGIAGDVSGVGDEYLARELSEFDVLLPSQRVIGGARNSDGN